MDLYNILKLAFEEKTMSRTQTLEIFLKLKSKTTSVQDTEHLGHFLNVDGIVIRSFSHKDKLLNNIYKQMFCGIKNFLKSTTLVTDMFNTTLLLLTLICLCMNLCP